MAGFDSEQLGGSERGERHRPPMRGPLSGGVFEVRDGTAAHPLVGRRAGRAAEGPCAATPAILDTATTVPSSLRVLPVARAPCDTLRFDEKPKADTCELS